MYDISYNGKSGMQHGIIVERRPSVPAPQKRVTEIEIPGRDGVLLESDETYGSITIPVEFNFLVPPNMWMDTYRRAKKWLSGSGWLVLGDDQEYMYRVDNCAIADTERSSWRLGRFTAEFLCNPYAFLQSGQREYPVLDVLYNHYDVSHPKYIISGNGTFHLTVNGNEIQGTINQRITIDTELMIAYNSAGVNQNNLITGDYEGLYLLEGDNTIEITDGFEVSVIPNWRER